MFFVLDMPEILIDTLQGRTEFGKKETRIEHLLSIILRTMHVQ